MSQVGVCLCKQEFAEQSYDSELHTLQETIQQKVVTLLSDADNTVKMTLIDNDIGRLCHFFGRQKGEVLCENGGREWGEGGKE